MNPRFPLQIHTKNAGPPLSLDMSSNEKMMRQVYLPIRIHVDEKQRVTIQEFENKNISAQNEWIYYSHLNRLRETIERACQFEYLRS